MNKNLLQVNMHSYARTALENQLEIMDELLNSEGPPAESSPEASSLKPPSKKPKTGINEEDEEPVFNSRLLTAIERIEKLQEESLKRLRSVETTVKGNTDTLKSVIDSLEYSGRQVEDVTKKTDDLQIRVETLEKENTVLREKNNDLDAYKRRWNLRIAGIPERSGENIKKRVIDLFGQISPDTSDQLPLTVDIVHRLGPRSGEERSSRRIIVQFLSRSHRDKIWKDARTSRILKERNIKLMEDLTRETKDARNKLWPMVEAARKEGKRAGFRGASALIDGKKFTVKDM